MASAASTPRKSSVASTPRKSPTAPDLEQLLANDSRRYSKKELKQHILDLPDTYIGSVVPAEVETWVVRSTEVGPTGAAVEQVDVELASMELDTDDTEEKKIQTEPKTESPLIVLRKITVTLGLFKIIDEILQNAADNVYRTRAAVAQGADVALATQIKITLGDDGTITVYNNGEGIPVVEHAEHRLLIPSLIFGELLTSGNYDPTEQRRWGGKHGYGSKVCNIYSLSFTVETVDRIRRKKFVQTWKNHMEQALPAKVTSYAGAPYTKVTFAPDYARFGCSGLTPDLKALLVRRAYDLAGVTGASVFLNGSKLPVRHFQHFTQLFLNKAIKPAHEIITDGNITTWDVVACPSPDGTFRHVSYVNGVSTFRGGAHVEWLANKIAKRLADQVNATLTKAQTALQPKHVKNNLWLFVSASVVNPAFSSQTKEFLTTAVKDLPPCELSDAFYEKLAKTDLVERAKLLKDFHEQKLLVKTDGRKTRTITGIPKLEDANQAGGRKARQCTLIVCEGDSARTFAISGLGVVGRDYYGVYPLKGKVKNIRGASTKEMFENQEINELKKILGLREGVKCLEDLRYGQLMVLTDEDVDGIHIKALILNLFDVFWPDVLRAGFVVSMYTPLIKVFRKNRTVEASFFTEQAFEAWKAQHPMSSGLTIKYYKGLGTHDRHEARECFESLQKIHYTYDAQAPHMLKLLFAKAFANQRKTWIAQHRHVPLDYTQKNLPISEFIDKGMILFSNASNVRSIPCLVDGFKPSQRKVLHGLLARKQTQCLKVSQLVGPISAQTAYHHGEVSLCDTIVKMAQHFVGSNNINLLQPSGQFGSRLKGGEDAASARYISTCLEPITRKIFVPDDDALLHHRQEDNKRIEPTFFLPVVPMVLINGAHGIGTGFSTSIPCFNPRDVIQAMRDVLTKKIPAPLVPWYRKFTGTIQGSNGSYTSTGRWTRVAPATVHITELPVGVWSDSYKLSLDQKVTDGLIAHYRLGNQHDDSNVDLYVSLVDERITEAQVTVLLELSAPLSKDSNMHVFDPYGHLVRFETALDLLRAFCGFRVHFYERRRQYQMQALRRTLTVLQEKIRFTQQIVDGSLRLWNRTQKDVCRELQQNRYLPRPHRVPIVVENVSVTHWVDASDPYVVKNALYSRDYAAETAPVNHPDPDPEDDPSAENNPDPEDEPRGTLLADYKYLVSISIFHLTREEIQKLQREQADAQAQWTALNQTTAADLWLKDLDALEQELPAHDQRQQ